MRDNLAGRNCSANVYQEEEEKKWIVKLGESRNDGKIKRRGA